MTKLVENRVDKSIITKLQQEYEIKLIQLKQNKPLEISLIPLTPMSDDLSIDILEFIKNNNEILDQCKTIKETENSITYRVEKII